MDPDSEPGKGRAALGTRDGLRQSAIRRVARSRMGVRPVRRIAQARFTVGMMRDFANGEERPASTSHTYGTPGVLGVNTERPSRPGVRTS